MASIAKCPQCTQTLTLPELATPYDYVECPACQATFLLANVERTRTLEAQILSHQPAPSQPSAAILSLETPDTLPLDTATPPEEPDAIRPLPTWESRLKRAVETHLPTETDSEKPEIGSASVPVAAMTEPDAPALLSEATAATEALSKIEPHPHLADELEPSPSELPSAHQRSDRSWVKTVAAVSTLSLLGIFLGLYALLWQKGTDLAGLDRYLPEAILPETHSEMPTPAMQSPAMTSPSHSVALALPADGVQQPAAPPLHHDPSVQTTLAEQTAPSSFTPRLSNQDFATLITEAREALPQLIEGDLSRPESIPRKGQAYMALCRLAEQMQPTADPTGTDAEPSEQRQDALVVFGRAFAATAARGDLATIALQWWRHPNRPNQGIVLAGRIEKWMPSSQGQTWCLVSLDDRPEQEAFPILMQNSALVVGSRIGIVGRITTVADAQFNPSDTDFPQRVVALHYFPLP